MRRLGLAILLVCAVAQADPCERELLTRYRGFVASCLLHASALFVAATPACRAWVTPGSGPQGARGLQTEITVLLADEGMGDGNEKVVTLAAEQAPPTPKMENLAQTPVPTSSQGTQPAVAGRPPREALESFTQALAKGQGGGTGGAPGFGGASSAGTGKGAGGTGDFFGTGVSELEDVVFVIDVSESMFARDMPGGASRIEVVRRELLRTLQELPLETRFNILFFGDAATAWRPGLVEMTPAVRKVVLEEMASLDARPETTYFVPALQAARRMNPRNLVFLSDGDPMDTSELYRYLDGPGASVPIHVVDFFSDSPLLNTLSTKTGGSLTKVEF